MLRRGARIGTLLLAGAAAGCAARPVDVAPLARACDGVEVLVRHRAADGPVAIALYDSAPSWRDGAARSTARVASLDRAARWCVPALPPGRYAVKAYLDVDGDGALGRGAFGRPTEPYGFSSGARGAFGPPSFDEAAFELRAGERALVGIELD